MKLKVVASMLLAMLCAGCAKEAVPPPVAGEAVAQSENAKEEIQYVEISARVVSIDYKKRLLTLQGPEGATETVTVGPEVQRLKEIKKGDLVVAQYIRSLLLEVREPTAEEKKNQKDVMIVAGKADASQPPMAGAGAAVQTVVKVTRIDHAAKTVTVKGPKGKTLTVKAKDPKNLEKIKVGDTIVVTYSEAFAIGVEPAKKK